MLFILQRCNRNSFPDRLNMMRFQILVFLILWVVAVIECQGPRPGPNGPPPATTASTTDVTDESSTDSSTSVSKIPTKYEQLNIL